MNNKIIDVYTLIKPEIDKLSKKGIKTAILDCRLILSKVLQKKTTVYTHEIVKISENQIENFHSLIREREIGKPISRIINKKNFWKSEFKLNEATLDPRPDTEILIESVLQNYLDKSQNLKILDLGSGSGCIGLSLMIEYVFSKVYFSDISIKSLEIAKSNVIRYNLLERSKFINFNWNLPKWEKSLLNFHYGQKFDLIVCNPPYIPSKKIKYLQTEIKQFDPLVALDGGKDGLSAYRSIFPNLKYILKSNGQTFFEIGKGQEYNVSSIAQDHGFETMEYIKDLSGIIRVIKFIIK